ncbi:MAG: hypothetical protein KDB23_15945, partial [Planctomycetales bacterium]|nr:hypothetical protein [Planctomycetales bacterium]
GIRALDYLLTRPEVEPSQIGITGNSGGGTMTTWLWALDDRWTMGAPSCFVTSFVRNAENELPADIEQCPPRALELNLDHADFLIAGAPHPLIILAKERDYFDVRGSQRAFQDAQRIYELLDAANKIDLFVGPTTHGYSEENRDAMYRWFDSSTGRTSMPLDEIPAEADQTLQGSVSGQVTTDGARTVFDFTNELAVELKSRRGDVSGKTLESAIHATLRLQVPAQPPEFRILRPRRSRGYPLPQAATYAVETEPGIMSIVYRLGQESVVSRPPRVGGVATLYLADDSSDAELRTSPAVRALAAERAKTGTFYACDVRGLGESRPDTCDEDSYSDVYGSDYFYAVHGIMLGDPYPGQRARDILRVVHWLEDNGHTEVEVVASGQTTVPALIAALATRRIKVVRALNDPISFQQIAESRQYDLPLSSMIPNVLLHFDVEDLVRELTAQGRYTVYDMEAASTERN